MAGLIIYSCDKRLLRGIAIDNISGYPLKFFLYFAEMVKLVDTLDSKSSGREAVPVRFRLSVPDGVNLIILDVVR